MHLFRAMNCKRHFFLFIISFETWVFIPKILIIFVIFIKCYFCSSTCSKKPSSLTYDPQTDGRRIKPGHAPLSFWNSRAKLALKFTTSCTSKEIVRKSAQPAKQLNGVKFLAGAFGNPSPNSGPYTGWDDFDFRS